MMRGQGQFNFDRLRMATCLGKPNAEIFASPKSREVVAGTGNLITDCPYLTPVGEAVLKLLYSLTPER
jgi:hypothetical protein